MTNSLGAFYFKAGTNFVRRRDYFSTSVFVTALSDRPEIYSALQALFV